MRREIFRSPRDRALDILVRAPFVHLATTGSDGSPILRALHAVVVDEHLCFHGAPAGEKLDAIGKSAVVQASEMVAELPSTFSDPERACPATTLYESAQLHGVITRVDDEQLKARALQALMQRYQPEGGHVPIAHDHARYGELYAAAVRGVLVLAISLEHLDGKSKLLQNKKPHEVAHIVEQLWARGRRDDVGAIARILHANPAVPCPAFLAAPTGFTLACATDDTYADDVAALLADTYWNVGVSREQLVTAHLNSSAWVVALDDDRRVVGSARALADGAKWAMIYDVIVHPDCRNRKLGDALVRLLLAHPAVRACRKLNLRTRDAQHLYARHGFEAKSSSVHIEMVLVRG
jgi:nitroimidazol reductase NimA-like FMN-containing flavoprotein (pyridoxamine 5'-phosphate oxidase superfamily)/ribosomal protein S18 acetylase RimI-like enzyme